MRNAVLGFVATTCLAIAVLCTLTAPSAVFAQRASSSHTGDTSGLITLSTPISDSRQQLTLIDPQMRSMCVYHIDSASGEITLKSVRNIHWDMQLNEFNGKTPLPREIRAMLDQK